MGDTDTRRRSILFATDETTRFWGLMPSPPGFECEHVCGWHDAVVAVTERHFDVIVTTYPLGDKPFRLFVYAVRTPTGRSNRAGLVVLTTPDQRDEAAGFIGQGVNRVISLDESDALHNVIAEVIDVSPRATARLMVHLQMPLGDRDCRIRTFSENISRSGMLLGTSNRLEIGQRIEFEFGLPGSDEVVTGSGEVVRHTVDKRDHASGIGIRFVDVEENGHRALEAFLEKVVAEELGDD